MLNSCTRTILTYKPTTLYDNIFLFYSREIHPEYYTTYSRRMHERVGGTLELEEK